jgi:hypothetical protein
MRWRVWFKRFTVAGVIFTVLVALAAVLIIRSEWARGEVRGLIETQANKFLDGTFKVGRVSGSLLRGVTLTDVTFEHAGQPAWSAKKIDLEYSAWSLARGGRQIGFIRFTDLAVHIAESKGRWSWNDWFRPRPPSGPQAPFDLARIELVNARVFASARESVWQLPPELDRVNGDIHLRIGGPTELTLNRLTFSTPDNAFLARSATGVITFDRDNYIFKSVRIDSTAGALDVSGTVGTVSAARPVALNLGLGNFNTRVWRKFSPLLDTVSLNATGPLTIGGTFDRTTISGRLSTTAGHIVSETVIASQTGKTTITGQSTVTNFNAEAVTADKRWNSNVNGRLSYTVVGTGTPASWVADVKLTGGPVHAFNIAADALDGNLKYANNRVTFDTQATAYGANGHVTGTIITSPVFAIDAAGDHLANVDPRRLPAEWGFPNLDANVGANTFSAHWTEREWRMNANLTDSTIEGGSIANGTTIELTSGGGVVTLAADGGVRGINARQLGHALQMTGLDDPLFESRLTGRVHVTGRGPNWTDIDLTGRGNLVDSSVGEARVTNAEVTFSRTAHHNAARIVGDIVGFDPVKFGGPAASAGNLNGAANISVEWQDNIPDVAAHMEARGTLRLTPSFLARESVDRGVISGEWRDGVFNAQSIELEGGGLHVTGRGRIAITAGESAATFEASADDVAVLEPWTGRKLTGPAKMQGELRGAFDAPRIVGTADSAAITDSILGAFTSVAATLDFTLPEWDSLRTNGPLRVQAASWTTPGGSVTREFVLDGALDSWTQFHGTAAGRMNEFLARAAFKADWAGELTADFTEAEISRGTDQWRIDPSVGHLRITSSRITATNLRLTNGVQAIGVDGSLLIADGELTPGDHLTATASNVDIAAVDQFLELGLGITGRVSATMALTGRLNDPRGRITLEGQELSVRGYQITEVCGWADIAAGGATVNVTMSQPDGVALRATGTLPLSAVLPAGSLAANVPTPDWNLSLVTEPVDLRILGPFMPRLDKITGQMIADVRIVGAAARPRATGTVAVADGAFVMPAEGIAFSHIDADIGLTPDLITVRRFVAQDKHRHPLTITGQLAVGEDKPGAFTVNLEADRIGVVDNAIGDVEVSALLQLSGDLSHPKLTGNIEVANSRIELDRLMRVLAGDPLALVAETNLPPEGETAVNLRAEAARAAAEAANRKPPRFDTRSFVSGLEADVRIIAPDDLILRGQSIKPVARDSWSLGDLNVTVGGELRATRQPGGDPIIVGDVTTVRGVYTFEGRRFEIQRGGRIRFNGENPPDPTFDLRGVRTIQGVEARVDVRGRLSDPTLQLGSNLPLDEADILSMIIFNRPVNQLGDAQRADLVGAAATLAGGFVTAPIAQRLSKALDLDLVEVETVTFGQNVSPRIRIGQQIGARLFVQFSQQFGPQSLSELTGEYQLTKYLRLQANTAQGPGSRAQRSLLQRTERFGLDLIFFFNY